MLHTDQLQPRYRHQGRFLLIRVWVSPRKCEKINRLQCLTFSCPMLEEWKLLTSTGLGNTWLLKADTVNCRNFIRVAIFQPKWISNLLSHMLQFFTARKRSCIKVMFSVLCVCVSSQDGFPMWPLHTYWNLFILGALPPPHTYTHPPHEGTPPSPSPVGHIPRLDAEPGDVFTLTEGDTDNWQLKKFQWPLTVTQFSVKNGSCIH